MKKLLWILLGAGLILGLLQGCGTRQEEVKYTGSECSFNVPTGWELAEEKKHQDVLTLQLHDKNRESSYITVTVFPAGMLAGAEAVEQAEKLLRTSLYALQDPVDRSELQLSTGELIPLVTARAGKRDTIEAQTAVVYGDRFHALVTLVARLENLDINSTEFQVFLNDFQLQ